jgi:hypothetical protein
MQRYRVEFLLSGAGAGLGAEPLLPCGRTGVDDEPLVLPDFDCDVPLPEPPLKVP